MFMRIHSRGKRTAPLYRSISFPFFIFFGMFFLVGFFRWSSLKAVSIFCARIRRIYGFFQEIVSPQLHATPRFVFRRIPSSQLSTEPIIALLFSQVRSIMPSPSGRRKSDKTMSYADSKALPVPTPFRTPSESGKAHLLRTISEAWFQKRYRLQQLIFFRSLW